MTSYLLDTNHASAVFKESAALNDRLRRRSNDSLFGLSSPGLGELWYMVFNSARIPTNSKQLKLVFKDFERWDLDEAAAEEFGRMKADLRHGGRTIPDADIQIAAIARVNDLVILTADAHFSYIPNLKIENWLS